MDARKLTKLRNDLNAFLDEVAGSLGHPRRRKWCDAYLRGHRLDGHRKSVEPMAARFEAVERGAEDYKQAIQQFLNQSPWDEQGFLNGLQGWIGRRFGPDGLLILDDTGSPKQGSTPSAWPGSTPGRSARWRAARWRSPSSSPRRRTSSPLTPGCTCRRRGRTTGTG